MTCLIYPIKQTPNLYLGPDSRSSPMLRCLQIDFCIPKLKKHLNLVHGSKNLAPRVKIISLKSLYMYVLCVWINRNLLLIMLSCTDVGNFYSFDTLISAVYLPLNFCRIPLHRWSSRRNSSHPLVMSSLNYVTWCWLTITWIKGQSVT